MSFFVTPTLGLTFSPCHMRDFHITRLEVRHISSPPRRDVILSLGLLDLGPVAL